MTGTAASGRGKASAKADYWPCACVRRRKGRLTHIKLNHPDRKRCAKCGCEKPETIQ